MEGNGRNGISVSEAAASLMGFRDNNNSSDGGNGNGNGNGGLSSMVMMNNNMSSPHHHHHHHYLMATSSTHQNHLPPPPPPPPTNVVEMSSNSLFHHPSNLSNSTNHHNHNHNHNHITHFAGSNSDQHHQIFNPNNNNNKNSSGGGGVGYFMKMNNNNNKNTTTCNNNNSEEKMSNSTGGGSSISSFRAKIMAHPHYPRLLTAYINCQKVGAPPEVVKRLEEVCAASTESPSTTTSSRGLCIGEDPALDQFMEAYCEMLTKYEQELTKPFKEAMLFISSIESQLKSLTVASSDSGGSGSPEEETDANDDNHIDPLAEDRELKIQLLRKYSGYLGSLKQEFLKKRKKGKLPKEARQQLLDWWSRHYKWPYPSESQKLALAESTGLDQKQINNWFINQRKRHWKPSEDMQFVVMDPAHPNQYYIENLLTNIPFSLDYCNQTTLL